MKVLGEYPNIDTSNVVREGISAFCNVMADVKNKQRTFFTYMGANARFTEQDIDWDRVGTASKPPSTWSARPATASANWCPRR